MSSAFGRAPAGALLRSLAAHLPLGSRIEFVTPIGQEVKGFLARAGQVTRRGFLRPKIWTITHLGPEGSVYQLAQLADGRLLTRLSVWFTVVGPDGTILLEAEDGNDTLFLADALSHEAADAVIQSVGASGPGVQSASLGRSREGAA